MSLQDLQVISTLAPNALGQVFSRWTAPRDPVGDARAVQLLALRGLELAGWVLRDWGYWRQFVTEGADRRPGGDPLAQHIYTILGQALTPENAPGFLAQVRHFDDRHLVQILTRSRPDLLASLEAAGIPAVDAQWLADKPFVSAEIRAVADAARTVERVPAVSRPPAPGASTSRLAHRRASHRA